MNSFFLAATLFATVTSYAQVQDTAKKIPVDSLPKKAAPVNRPSKIDSVLKVHSPRKAAIRSAILPGLGQIYNKKYWKLPIVYGALGTAGYVFFFNLKTYRELRDAFRIRYPEVRDTDAFNRLAPIYQQLEINQVRNFRDQYRQNIDYSVLVFILLWGLNVADAAVDAHLKSFDVSPDLGFHLRFGHSQLAGTNGVSFVLAFK
jgi:hypothetical protein